MNIIVTGASGFLGNVLCRLLIRQGHQVTAIALDATTAKSLADLDLTKIDADIRDHATMSRLFQNQHIIFHLASIILITQDKNKLMHAVNVEGTRSVAEAALKANVQRFIHVSSIHALSGYPKDQMIDEQRELALSEQHLDYDRTKALAELELQKWIARGLKALIVNPTAFVGPYDFEPSLTGDAVHKFLTNKNKIMLHLPGGFNFVDVRDIAETLIQTMSKGSIGERYILGGEWVTIREMVHTIAEAGHFQGRSLSIPFTLAKFFVQIKVFFWQLTGKRVLYSNQSIQHLTAHRYIDDTKARKVLNHKSRSLLESFKDTYEWLLQTR